jgi:serine/threonine-protein kinase
MAQGERTSRGRKAPVPIPESLFGFEVIQPIGHGAGSVIYAACQPKSNQLYALKHVQVRGPKDHRLIEQLQRELEVGQKVTHPALRRSFEIRTRRSWFGRVVEAVLALELVDGLSLDLRPPPDLAAMMECFIQTAQGLQAMHHLGYVHCDVKPNNILLDLRGRVKLIDLGQACMIGTVKERIQGTPDFIAPEQVKRRPATCGTDVFNLGATMYWVLSGRKLPTLYNLDRSPNSFLLDKSIPAPQEINGAIPEILSNLVMECVRTNPAKRPSDMADVARRLEVILYALRLHGAVGERAAKTDAPARPPDVSVERP